MFHIQLTRVCSRHRVYDPIFGGFLSSPRLISGFPQMPGWRFEEPNSAKIDAKGKLAFALGEQSPYSTGPRRDRIQAVFENVKEVVVVEKCPHWVHIVRGEELAAVVAKWMVV